MSEQIFEQIQEDSVKGLAKRENDPVPEELYEKIYNDVMSEVQRNLSQMKPQLVREVADMAVQKVTDKYEKQINILERKINMLKKLLMPKPSVPPSTLPPTSENRDKIIDVSRIYSGFRFDGWIYYANEDMGNFLYRVREDGRDNTQLTDYSVSGPYSISDGYLSFWSDNPLVERKMKLRRGK